MNNNNILEIMNAANSPRQMLVNLETAGFNLKDKTVEGDSILHLLPQSVHFQTYTAARYVKALINAGADSNATNASGQSVSQCYFALNSDIAQSGSINALLEDANLDVNHTTDTGVSLAETIISSDSCYAKGIANALFKHPKFNPNQKTSQCVNLAFYLIKKSPYYSADLLEILLKHPEFDANTTNEDGQTVIAHALSEKAYHTEELITKIENLKNFDVNKLDKDGNNYLQLVIKHLNHKKNDYFILLSNKGINLLHKNHDSQSVIDLILENSLSSYAMKDALMFCKKCPELITLPLKDGKSLLNRLLKINPYTVEQALTEIADICRKTLKTESPLQEAANSILDEYNQGSITNNDFKNAATLCAKLNIDIDIERGLAVSYIKGDSYAEQNDRNFLCGIRKIDFGKVVAEIDQLTPPGSAENKAAIALVKADKFKQEKFDLDCFDSDILAIEEKMLRKTLLVDGKDDTVMFGHLFSLEGSVPHAGKVFTLTGSSTTLSGWFMGRLMNAYVEHCEKTGKYAEHLGALKQTRNMAIKALRYYEMTRSFGKYSSLSIPDTDTCLQAMVADANNQGVEVFTGWSGHGIDILIKGNTLYRNNAGGCSRDATTEVYAITKPEQLTPDVFRKLVNNDSTNDNKIFIQRDLHSLLGLKLLRTHKGKFQTVGNCSLESKRTALLQKYQLFLPADVASEIYADTLNFFESSYLREYINNFQHDPILLPVLMRLILQRLIPDNNLTLAKELITNHFKTDEQLEYLQIGLMLAKWKIERKLENTDSFNAALASLGVTLNPDFNARTKVLAKALTNTLKPEDIVDVKSWPPAHCQFQGHHLLHIAVMNDNLPLAESLLKSFPHVKDQTDWFDMEPLCHAKSPAMVNLLVQNGVKVSRTEYDNALDYAIKSDNVDLVKAMLKAGVKPSEYTAYYAASKSNAVLSALLECHPNAANTNTHSHRQAIHAAAIVGHSENIRTLMYVAGADPNALDVNGVSPTEEALANGKLDVARDLIANPLTLFSVPHRGDSAAESLSDENLKKEMAETQKQKKADLAHFHEFMKNQNGRFEEDVDKLILAIYARDERAIRGCLLAHPDMKVVKWSELYAESPLASAILKLSRKTKEDRTRRLDIIKALLKTRSIDINATIGSTEPLIMMATSMDDVEVLELFLADKNLDPNLQDNVGYNALMDAAERGHHSCLRRLLLDPRVDSRIKNNRGQTADQLLKFSPETRTSKAAIIEHKMRLQGSPETSLRMAV